MEEKITILNEIKDEMMNRVIIIHKDGSMDVVASLKTESSYYHIKYFKKYLSENYLDDELLQNYSKKATEPSTLIFLLLKNKGDIVITETTKDLEENRHGIFYIPDVVSTKQYEKLENLKETHFNKFEEFLVYAKFYLNEFQMIDNEVYEHMTPPNFSILDQNLCVEDNKVIWQMVF